jgi:hypothetical protein
MRWSEHGSTGANAQRGVGKTILQRVETTNADYWPAGQIGWVSALPTKSERERMALKAVRGDFDRLPQSQRRASATMQAVEA